MPSSQGHLPTAARLLLGAIFTVFGLNGFLNFLPAPPPLSVEGGAFIGALAATGYMFPLIKGTEVIAGLLLLGNRFAPLALALLAPIVVNIVAFHALLSPGLGLPLTVLALELYLTYSYRDAYRSMLAPRVTPTPTPRWGRSTRLVEADA